MSRIVCHLCEGGRIISCVNNYRGDDYGKPDEQVNCVDCIFNPVNEGKVRDEKDLDKVIKNV